MPIAQLHPQDLKTWADTINDEPLALVAIEATEVVDPRFSLRDSASELKAGCHVDFIDTIPSEFMEYFK